MVEVSLAMADGRVRDDGSSITACSSYAGDGSDPFRIRARENVSYWQRYP